MPQFCDMCGAREAKFRAKVAGTEGFFCEECASHGQIIEGLRDPRPEAAIASGRSGTLEAGRERARIERTEEVVDNIGEQVRLKREELGLKQDELGRRISEPGSLIRRIEHGFIPRVKTARKLERALKLNLTEFVNPNEQGYSPGKSGGATTLGDVIVIKKSKKSQ